MPSVSEASGRVCGANRHHQGRDLPRRRPDPSLPLGVTTSTTPR